ncbi:MAG: type IV toxin-antitoxin system AbiEi family antitoxin domain-containing protein [Trebonia sp.]
MGSRIPPSLRALIAEQAGVVSRRQVLAAGVSRSTITSKVKHGLWQQLHLGVYAAFTGEIRWEARLWAAVLYAGPGALLSHETAAVVLGLTDRRSPVIQVTIPASRRVRPPRGVAIHLSSYEYPRWRPRRGVPPHTSCADTIIDLVAAADNLDDVVGWVSRGIARNLIGEGQLKAAAAARRRFRWRDQIDEVIERVAGGSHFPLEFRYDRDVERAHGLPTAARQARFVKPGGTSGFRDRCYEKYGLIVELDGQQFHQREQRGRDRVRDNEAAATTGATLRYGWVEVDRTPCETAGQVHRALRLRGYPGPMRPCSATCRAFLAP